MTIVERLREKHLKRIEKLQQLHAPEIIIENEQKLLRRVDTIYGVSEYGHLEFTAERQQYGARCGTYYVYDTNEGPIAFFPNWGGRLKPFQLQVKIGRN